jgi:membrane protein implicated in regulation of membrane protease activity
MLDVRLPIGALWMLMGALLVAYGFAASGGESLAIDRWWGGAMFWFGAVMLALAGRRQARLRNEARGEHSDG